MKEGIDITTKRVSGDEAINDVISARAKLAKVQRELAAVTKDRDDLLLEYNSLQKTKYPAPPKPAKARKTKDDFVRIVVNDVHGQMMDYDAVSAFLTDLKQWDADEIVLNGDIVECGGFLAAHHALGYVAQTEYSWQEDIAAGNWFLDQIQKAAPKAVIHFIEGNHECLHPDHEVLTTSGWLPISEITTEDIVATLTPEGRIAWQQPSEIHAYSFDGDMVLLQSRAADALMTPNHRVAHYGQHGGDLKYRRADSMLESPSAVAVIPTSGQSGEDSKSRMSEDQIRLTAWIMADGHISARAGISQSKPDMIERIKELLDRMGIQYGLRVRNRDPRPINGVVVKTAMESVCFDITNKSTKEKVAPLFGIQDWNYKSRYKKEFPQWLDTLSDSEFKVFIDEYLLADGTKCSSNHPAFTIYGTEENLSRLQEMCVTHGYRASLKPRSRKGVFSYWALNVSPRTNTKTESKNYSLVPYAGMVYCLTTESSNFFTRYNGTVHVTGNCRVERWITDQTMRHGRDAEFLKKLIAPKALLKADERGMHYYGRDTHHIPGLPPGWIKLGKIFFVHELAGGKNAARDSVNRTAGNVVYAHTHVEDTATTVLPGVGLVKAFNPGCLCQRQPLWRHSNPTGWSHGYAVQFVSKSDEFLHINIPIWSGRSLVGSMHGKMKG